MDKVVTQELAGLTLVELYPLRAQVLDQARQRGICEVCEVCDGRACAGRMPGMGSVGSGASTIRNYTALAEYGIVTRVLDTSLAPDLRRTLFGVQLDAPVLPAPMAATPFNLGTLLEAEAFARDIYVAGRAVGSVPMMGHCNHWPPFAPDDGEPPADASLQAIPVIKPLQDAYLWPILDQIVAGGVPAVGIDIDSVAMGVVFPNLPVEAKSPDQLRQLAASLPIPLILKGVMNQADAEQAIAIGAGGIVVSNHGGRILDGLPGGADVLPEIVDAVAGRIPVLVDGGVRSGYDAFKYLALGADAVLVGRPLIIGVTGRGAQGAQIILECIIQELKQATVAAGCHALSDINRACVRRLKTVPS